MACVFAWGALTNDFYRFQRGFLSTVFTILISSNWFSAIFHAYSIAVVVPMCWPIFITNLMLCSSFSFFLLKTEKLFFFSWIWLPTNAWFTQKNSVDCSLAIWIWIVSSQMGFDYLPIPLPFISPYLEEFFLFRMSI